MTLQPLSLLPACLLLSVVVNCSLFNPTPSLSAMLIHHFKMRSDIDSYNLGGWVFWWLAGWLAWWAVAGWVGGWVLAAQCMPIMLVIACGPPAPLLAGGMGCSAGVIAVDLAAKVLRVR